MATRFSQNGCYIIDTQNGNKYFAREVFDINAGEFSHGLSMNTRFDIIKDIGIEACLLSLKQAYESQGKPYSSLESLEQLLDSFVFSKIREVLAMEALSLSYDSDEKLALLADEMRSRGDSEEEIISFLKIRKMLFNSKKEKKTMALYAVEDYSNICHSEIRAARTAEEKNFKTRFDYLKNGAAPKDDIDEAILIMEQLKNINRR